MEKEELGPSSSRQGGAIGAPLTSLSFQKDGNSPGWGACGYVWRHFGLSQLGGGLTSRGSRPQMLPNILSYNVDDAPSPTPHPSKTHLAPKAEEL